MILFIASRGIAGGLRRGLRLIPGGAGSRVLVPEMLSVPGRDHDPDRSDHDRMVIDGRVRSACPLTGVVTGLDAVQPGDLPHVAAGDRAFVAAEMTAFLRVWLTTLPCPVVDPPTAIALSGPAGESATWSAAATELGVAHRRAAPFSPARATTVTVIHNGIIGPVPAPAIAAAALALTRTARVTAARLTFAEEPDGPVLLGALPWWNFPSPLVLRAILTYLPREERPPR